MSQEREALVIPIPKGVVFPSQSYAVLTVRGRLGSRWAQELQDLEATHVVLAPSFANTLKSLSATDIAKAGTLAKIVSLTPKEGKGFKLTVRAQYRVTIKYFVKEEPGFVARVLRMQDLADVTQEEEKEFRSLMTAFLDAVRPPERMLREKLRALVSSAPLSVLADTYASIWKLPFEDKLTLLETPSLAKRLRIVGDHIKSRVETSPSASASSAGSKSDELAELRKRLEDAGVPEEQMVTLSKDLKRLANINPQSAEHDLLHNYLDFAASLPWTEPQLEDISLDAASKQLEADHCGLKDVKRRVLEYLAVLKHKDSMQGPILCLMGPPGVGKSSVAKSVAKALGRPFVRISLGGVSDEAVIRGHRRTYVGAMPGRVLDAMKRAGSCAPLILLDEIDKLGRDHRGDPASALLEVLDPVQNDRFTDSYLNLPFDLSKVLFVCTGNYKEGLPAPLADRMEVIDVPGYSDEEKVQIAQQHLVPQQLEAHGMAPASVHFAPEAMLELARGYTREAGVRNLTKHIASVIRYLTAKLVREGERDVSSGSLGETQVTLDLLEEILGPSKFDEVKRTLEQRLSRPGVSTGLAWTGQGGGALLFIECAKMPGKGDLILTGQLGDVMKESCQTALSWIRSNAESLGIPDSELFLHEQDIHVHFPAGAVPKDGPSAGVAVTVALVSLFTGRKVRSDCAMTGETSLRGVVLPIGGVKEKATAAARNGISLIFLPKRNAIKDLHDLSDAVKAKVKFVGVDNVEEVLQQCFQDTNTQRAKL